MRDLLFLIVLTILLFLIEKLLNKFLGIEKRKISETFGIKVDQWGRCILAVVLLCSFPFILEKKIDYKGIGIFFLTIYLGFQSFLEWKYIKNSNQYIVTLILLLLSLIILYNIEYFVRLFNL